MNIVSTRHKNNFLKRGATKIKSRLFRVWLQNYFQSRNANDLLYKKIEATSMCLLIFISSFQTVMKNIFVPNGDTFAKVDLVTWEDLEEEAKHRLFMGVKEEMITSGLQILLKTFIKWKVRR